MALACTKLWDMAWNVTRSGFSMTMETLVALLLVVALIGGLIVAFMNFGVNPLEALDPADAPEEPPENDYNAPFGQNCTEVGPHFECREVGNDDWKSADPLGDFYCPNDQESCYVDKSPLYCGIAAEQGGALWCTPSEVACDSQGGDPESGNPCFDQPESVCCNFTDG